MDALLNKLSEQQTLLDKQVHKKDVLSSDTPNKSAKGQMLHESGSSSPPTVLMTPISGSSNDESGYQMSKEDETIKLNVAEMVRLKQELDDAKDQIARQKQELDQTRIMKHTLHQAIGSPANTDVISNGNPMMGTNGTRQTTLSPSSHTGNLRQDVQWDARSAISDTPSLDNYHAGQNIWQSSAKALHNGNFNTAMNPQYQSSGQIWGPPGGRTWGNKMIANNVPQMMMPQQQQMLQQRTFSGPASQMSATDFNQFQGAPMLRRSNTQTRAASLYPQVRDNGWDAYGGQMGSLDGMTMSINQVGAGPYQPPGMFGASIPYQPRPIGTPLSPTAAEFRGGTAAGNPWNAAVSQSFLHLIQHRANLLRSPRPPQSRHTFHHWSLSTIVAFLTVV